MPFKSESQRRYLFAKHPDVAKEFAAHTPKGKKLPEHVRDAEKKGAADALARFGFKRASEELRLKIPSRTFHGFDEGYRAANREKSLVAPLTKNAWSSGGADIIGNDLEFWDSRSSHGADVHQHPPWFLDIVPKEFHGGITSGVPKGEDVWHATVKVPISVAEKHPSMAESLEYARKDHARDQEHIRKKAANEDTADVLEQLLTMLEAPKDPLQQTTSNNPQDKTTAWSTPQNIASSDTGGF